MRSSRTRCCFSSSELRGSPAGPKPTCQEQLLLVRKPSVTSTALQQGTDPRTIRQARCHELMVFHTDDKAEHLDIHG